MVCVQCQGLFAFTLGVIGWLYYANESIPGFLLYYFCRKRSSMMLCPIKRLWCSNIDNRNTIRAFHLYELK